MAARDPISCVIRPDGWTAEVTMESMGVGGTYSWGFGADNDPRDGTPKFVLTVVSKGFDSSGNATTHTRTIYGTDILRKPYNLEAENQETVAGSNVVLVIALSDFVYEKDNTGAGKSGTAPTVSIAAGWYSQGGASNAVTGMAVTNNSTLQYVRPVGNWSIPDRRVAESNTIEARCVAFHIHAENGNPVACVKFDAADEHSHSSSQTLSAATIAAGWSDAKPVIEYVGAVDISTFDNGDVGTLNFKAYPRIGDTPLDTADGVNTNPSPNYAPQKFLIDRTGAYGGSEAYVDPVSGTAGGSSVARGAGDEGSTPAFQTILQAINAIIARNEAQYGRRSSDHSIVYLKEGAHTWYGSGSLTGSLTAQKTYLTVKRAPSAARDNVTLVGQSGTPAVQQYIKVQGITLANTSQNTLTGHTLCWAHDCKFDHTTSLRQPLHNNTVNYATSGVVINLSQGMTSYSAIPAIWGLIRGVTLTNADIDLHHWCVIGTLRAPGTAQTMTINARASAGTGPLPQTPIMAFNSWHSLSESGTETMNLWNDSDTIPAGYVGTAFVQNLLENSGGGSSPLFWVAADGTTQPIQNVIIWNNTIVGQRSSILYNDKGTASVLKTNCSYRNNIQDVTASKTDIFNDQHPGSAVGPNGNRIGNWSVQWGVSCSGEYRGHPIGMTAAGAFPAEFLGLSSFQGDADETVSQYGYVDHKACVGASATAGGGDYHLTEGSRLRGMALVQVLPYDLEGNARGSDDSPGVFTTYEAPPAPTGTLNANITTATTVLIG